MRRLSRFDGGGGGGGGGAEGAKASAGGGLPGRTMMWKQRKKEALWRAQREIKQATVAMAATATGGNSLL